jgi:hypothetical protein
MSDLEIAIKDLVDNIDKELKENLSSEIFSDIDIHNFDDFNCKDFYPECGEFIFELEQKYLKEAMRILKVFSISQSKSCLRITLFKNRVILSLFCQNSFMEIVLPLLKDFDSEGVVKKERISFTFDFDIMFKVSQEFIGSDLKIRFNSEKNLIQIFSDQTKLELEANKERTIEYHNKIKEIKYLQKINLEVFQNSMKYISYFVHKNNLQKFLALAEFREGYLTGGSYSNLGIYQSDRFDNLNFRIGYENLNSLCRLPNYFNLENTHLFESEDYYILRDENLYFGIEKINFSFPSIEKFLKLKATETILLSRISLLNSLRRLSIVLDDKMKINFKISGEDNLKLSIKDLAGRISIGNLKIQRLDSKFEEREFSMELEPFQKVLHHFKNPKIEVRLIENKALILVDEVEGGIITSYFNLV